jgi:hypothetical protein
MEIVTLQQIPEMEPKSNKWDKLLREMTLRKERLEKLGEEAELVEKRVFRPRKLQKRHPLTTSDQPTSRSQAETGKFERGKRYEKACRCI